MEKARHNKKERKRGVEMKEKTKSIKFEVVGSRIEIIGGSIYPKEEGWSFLCPCCEKWLKAKLSWNQGACEFNFHVEKRGGV